MYVIGTSYLLNKLLRVRDFVRLTPSKGYMMLAIAAVFMVTLNGRLFFFSPAN